MNVIVSQYGSRRRYMVPQILEKHQMLQALYTDSNSQSLLGKLAQVASKYNAGLRRLISRKPNLPDDKVKSNDILQLKLLFARLQKNPIQYQANLIYEGSSNKFIKWGIKKADWLYSMFIENFEFTKYAKENGAKILVDIYEDPFVWDELVEEMDLKEYRDIGSQKKFYEAQSILRHRYTDEVLRIADQYLIPSNYVANRLAHSSTFDPSKVNIIPYASSVNSNNFSNKSVKGRILWVGNDPVRKGLVYCARSANILKKKYPYLDFRIVGIVPEGITKSKYFSNLNFIGYCNKEQLKEEYETADLLVFPTLGEGFSAGLLEAASIGVPIITTRASGFDSDFPGIFVEMRNHDMIVDSVIKLLENRKMRNDIAYTTYEYSQSNRNDFESNLLDILLNK